MPEFFDFNYVQANMHGPIRGVVHIGAHYAEEANEYSKYNWDVLWFEAHPEYAKAMHDKLKSYRNQLGFGLCLSDKDYEDVVFWTTKDEFASSMLKPKLHQSHHPHAIIDGNIRLVTTRFDTWAQQSGFDYTKYNLLILDVQGAEDKVFRGMGSYIDHFEAIITEYSTIEYYENVPSLFDLDELFEDFVRVFPDEHNILPHADALYIRKK